MLKLTEHVGITISRLYKQKIRWNYDIQNFYCEIFNFRLFYAKNRNLAQFSGPACLYDVITTLWCLENLRLENLGGCNNPPWLDVLQKILCLDEG